MVDYNTVLYGIGMEEISNFRNLPQSKFNYILLIVSTNQEETDGEELLFQNHCIEDLLISLDNLSEGVC